MASLNGLARLAPQACPAVVRLGRADAVQRVGDRAIAGAAAEIALQRMRQVGPLRLGRAPPTVMIMPAAQKPHWKGLRVEEGLLHRMQLAVGWPAPRWW